MQAGITPSLHPPYRSHQPYQAESRPNTIKMGPGSSYRPPYTNDWAAPKPPRADFWRPSGNTNQDTGQGDWRSSRPKSLNAYAIVDAWRSYREDATTLNGERNNWTLNPIAAEFTPANALPTDLQLQPPPYFKRYEPLRSVRSYARYPEYRVTKAPTRFSNGKSEAQVVKSFRNSGLNSSFIQSRRSYPTNPVGAEEKLQRSIGDCPLLSIEPGEDFALKANTVFDEFRNNHARRSTPRRTPQRTVSPPVAPEASEVYLAQARLPPIRRPTPKKCLVILDLNGTCIARPSRFEPKVFKVRPGIHKLFDYLFEHHVVMIFTSMHPQNAAAIVDKLFASSQREKLAAFWARDKLGLTAEQLHTQTQTYKNLMPIWSDRSIQATYPSDQDGCGWDQSNTVLIDDSHMKAASHPHNLLLVPEFTKKDAAKHKLHPDVERREEAMLQSLISKLEELKYQTDVSRLIRQWQIDQSQIPRNPRRGLMMEGEPQAKSGEPVQLMTPESTVDTSSEDSQDDEVHLKLSAQLKILAEDETRQRRGVSEVPEAVWADLLNGHAMNSR